MAIETKDIVVKKMVYHYLSNYAHSNPEMAIMVIILTGKILKFSTEKINNFIICNYFLLMRSASTPSVGTAITKTLWFADWPSGH